MTGTLLKKVFHPSGFERGDLAAFAHALRIAVAAEGELTVLHVEEPPGDVPWTDFPGVRDTLSAWEARGAESPGAAGSLGPGAGHLQVTKIQARGRGPARTIAHHVSIARPDLVVLSTHQRQGLSRWLHGSVAEPVARESGAMTLFVPMRVQGFVSTETGAVRLENVLVPVDHAPPPQQAADAACLLAATLGSPAVRFTLLHVGREEDSPPLSQPDRAGWTWQARARRGEIVETILSVAEEEDVDLIAMATRGHDGFLDALRGSTTERVLRGARCPLLAVPARG
ncbi:MAG: universal stress protein [Planctomycetes bacterium]|nr:universal stress protein [Planctomycetota bacterium]